jgi:hypothetical protein
MMVNENMYHISFIWAKYSQSRGIPTYSQGNMFFIVSINVMEIVRMHSSEETEKKQETLRVAGFYLGTFSMAC